MTFKKKKKNSIAKSLILQSTDLTVDRDYYFGGKLFQYGFLHGEKNPK